jgi:hypothetical protein
MNDGLLDRKLAAQNRYYTQILDFQSLITNP